MSSADVAPAVLLAVYCLAAFLAALGGGLLPSLVRLTHTRMQVAISFVAGLMLGLALLGLAPHAMDHLGSTRRGSAWLLAGFVVMFLLQRFMPFHHHDVAEGSPVEPCGHTHSLAERSARTLSWVGIAVGLSLHSVFDGLAMAAAAAAGQHSQGSGLGLGTALAVILHKPFGALAITTLMAAGNATGSSRWFVNLGFALVTPLGALLFFIGAGQMVEHHPAWLGTALAFCAGTFLYVAGADLLPELQFHRHDRVPLTLALLAGVGIAVIIVRSGHGEDAHDHPAAPKQVALQAAITASPSPPELGPAQGETATR